MVNIDGFVYPYPRIILRKHYNGNDMVCLGATHETLMYVGVEQIIIRGIHIFKMIRHKLNSFIIFCYLIIKRYPGTHV